MATIHDQLKALHQQINRLEQSDDLILLLQGKAKTDAGRLTPFGKDFLLICHNNDIPVGVIAKILDITSSAVTQNIAKMSGALNKR